MSLSILRVAVEFPLLAIPTGSAERVSYFIGLGLVLLSFLAAGAFGIFVVVNAFRKRTWGWIIAAIFCGILFLGLGALSVQNFVNGFKRGFDRARAARLASGTVAPKATAPEILTGKTMPFTIEQPAGWWVKRDQGVYDVLMSNDSTFIGVIAEEADLGGAENVATLARERIDSSATEVTMTDNEAVTIDGRNWLAFTAKCKVQNLPFAYQYYVYSGKEGTIQLLGWTYQNLWDRAAEPMRKAMQTIKLPQVPEAAAVQK